MWTSRSASNISYFLFHEFRKFLSADLFTFTNAKKKKKISRFKNVEVSWENLLQQTCKNLQKKKKKKISRFKNVEVSWEHLTSTKALNIVAPEEIKKFMHKKRHIVLKCFLWTKT